MSQSIRYVVSTMVAGERLQRHVGYPLLFAGLAPLAACTPGAFMIPSIYRVKSLDRCRAVALLLVLHGGGFYFGVSETHREIAVTIFRGAKRVD
jgi:acetyl esterase/lipase